MKNKTPKICLGIDWGAKKIGLAIGDDFTRVAVPFMVVKTLAEAIKIIKQEHADLVVVGEPLTLANKRSQAAGPFAKFLADLKQAIKQPVVLVDERLTSKLADNLRHQAGDKRAQRATADQDAVAAMLILEAYFNKTKS